MQLLVVSLLVVGVSSLGGGKLTLSPERWLPQTRTGLRARSKGRSSMATSIPQVCSEDTRWGLTSKIVSLCTICFSTVCVSARGITYYIVQYSCENPWVNFHTPPPRTGTPISPLAEAGGLLSVRHLIYLRTGSYLACYFTAAVVCAVCVPAICFYYFYYTAVLLIRYYFLT